MTINTEALISALLKFQAWQDNNAVLLERDKALTEAVGKLRDFALDVATNCCCEGRQPCAPWCRKCNAHKVLRQTEGLV